MLNDFIDEKYLDPDTGLVGYGTWGIIDETDPEVDSPYLTCYAAVAEIISFKKHVDAEPFCLTFLGNYYRNLLSMYIHYEDAYKILFRRYPKAGQNYIYGSHKNAPKEAHFNNPNNLSGDNTIPIIILMGELGLKRPVMKALKTHINRGFFYQNYFTNNGERKICPDFMAFHTSIFLRSLNNRSLYIPLLITDIFFFCNIFVHVVYSWFKKDNTASELNYLFPLIQSKRFMPTPLSWLACKLYTLRGKIYADEPRITGAVKEFFTIRGDKRPPYHITLKPIINLYFGEI